MDASTKLIKEQGAALQAVEVADERAGELAREVEAMCQAGIRLSAAAVFEDDPLDFLAVLARTAAPEQGREH